jgi:hypothetical protein
MAGDVPSKIISPRHAHYRLPIELTLGVLACLKAFEAPGWVWGAVGAVVILYWVMVLYAITHTDFVVLIQDPVSKLYALKDQS